MAKNTTPSFVVTRRIITDNRGYDKLNKIMRITERMYNAGVRHCIKQLYELKKDVWYKYCLGQFFACKDEKKAGDGAKKYSYVLQHISLPSMTFIHISEEARYPDMKAESESILYRKLLLLFIVQ